MALTVVKMVVTKTSRIRLILFTGTKVGYDLTFGQAANVYNLINFSLGPSLLV